MNNVKVFNVTEWGYDHKKIEKLCEDYSGCWSGKSSFTKLFDDSYICVVADGHGNDNYTRADKGSKFAVESAITTVQDFIKQINDKKPFETQVPKDRLLNDNHEDEDKKEYNVILRDLSKSIIAKWYNLLIDDYNKNKFTEDELKEVDDKYKKKYYSLGFENVSSDDLDKCSIISKAYGTTLIIFAITDKFCFGLQIGDGKCIALDENGIFFEPIPWDEQCQFNETTSLCDSDALDEFRFYYSKGKPVAIFCGSDGIDDSFAGIEEVKSFYKAILRVIAKTNFETGIKEIAEYLPELTKKGSGDDVSISGIIDLDRFNQMDKKLLDEEKVMKKSQDCTKNTIECNLSDDKNDEKISETLTEHKEFYVDQRIEEV